MRLAVRAIAAAMRMTSEANQETMLLIAREHSRRPLPCHHISRLVRRDAHR
jgi:hypothetical protein